MAVPPPLTRMADWTRGIYSGYRSSTTAHGVPVYRLAWTSFLHNAGTPIRETLDLAAAGDHAPVSETSKSARSSQVDLFMHWGSAPAVTAPPDSIPFSTAFSR